MKKAICIYLTIVLVLTGCGNLKGKITGEQYASPANQLTDFDNENQESGIYGIYNNAEIQNFFWDFCATALILFFLIFAMVHVPEVGNPAQNPQPQHH